MKAIALCLLASAIVLNGCVTGMTTAGAMVRQITHNEVAACRFLGVVDGSSSLGNTIGDNQRGALNEVRNKVAELGGNAFLLRHGFSEVYGTAVQAEAYLCPDTLPLPREAPAKIERT
jgi:hypothetical protein